MALLDERRLRSRSSPSNARTGAIRRSARCIRRRSGWSARSAISIGLEPVGLPDTRPWLDLGFWDVQHPLGRAAGPAARTRAVRVPAGRGREPAPDSGRPGACRHHRAGPFPLHRQRRDGGAARAAPRLRAQGHRGADGGRRPRQGGAACRPHLRRQHGRLCARLRARGRGGARIEAPPRARLSARADGRARAPRQSFRRHRRDLQRCLVLASCMPNAASCASACCAPPTRASATG